MEALPDDVVVRFIRPTLRREVEYAQTSLEPLPRWSAIPEKSYAASTAVPNHVRARRVLDYILPGERIADIGVNYGYLSGLILRERRPEHYAGFDLGQHQLDSVQSLIDERRLDPPSVELALGDVYELGGESLGRHRPGLVLLTEVLEHVSDAEEALARIAAALPPAASILFTVPLFGRHDTCWGHRSVFDVVRVREMSRQAGLTVYRAEPVHNRWLFVLAGRSPTADTPRLAALDASGWPSAVSPRVHRYATALVNERALRVSKRWCVRLREPLEVERGAHWISVGGCSVQGGTSYLGVRALVPGFHFARFELEVSGDSVARVFIDTHAGRERIARWRWDRQEGYLPFDRPFTVVARNGRRAGPLRPVETGDLTRADSVELFVQLEGPGHATVRVLRARVLPS
jgi:2-polyprenyl-3-methyl-5-hydroxy-6-metoxy-1,4-benzoquinol methylase